MAILGNLIKGVVDLAGSVHLTEKSPADNQHQALKNLLETAQNTAFGQYYDFKGLLGSENIYQEYRTRVPIHSYTKMNDRWWKQQQKYPNITWPGKPKFFALSSGTTGKKSKRIPVTDDMISDSRAVGGKVIGSLNNFGLPTEAFESEVLMLGSSANLKQHKNGFLEGEISGINTYNFPEWYNWFYRPGKEIAAIDSWDDRLAAIVREAPNWNIGSIAGIPSWVQLMLKAIISEYKLSDIHDIWPNLSIYSTGGVAFQPFQKSFNALTKRPLKIIDTYLASEGFFGFTDLPNSDTMRLITDAKTYYEFIPFDSRGFDQNGEILKDPTCIGIEKLEAGQEYALVISTCSGAWRYTLGDTIKFSDVKELQFKITGRTKFFLNVVGSQLSEEKLNAASKHLSESVDHFIDEFSVACIEENGHYYHQWILAGDTLNSTSASEYANIIDRHLQEANKNYKVARGKALHGVKVKVTTSQTWYNVLGSLKKKGGQIKTPKVVKKETMGQYLDAISSIEK